MSHQGFPRYCSTQEPWHKVPCPRDVNGVCLVHNGAASGLTLYAIGNAILDSVADFYGDLEADAFKAGQVYTLEHMRCTGYHMTAHATSYTCIEWSRSTHKPREKFCQPREKFCQRCEKLVRLNVVPGIRPEDLVTHEG